MHGDIGMKFEVWMLIDDVWHPVPKSTWPVKAYALRAADVWTRLGKIVEVREIEGEDSKCHDS